MFVSILKPLEFDANIARNRISRLRSRVPDENAYNVHGFPFKRSLL